VISAAALANLDRMMVEMWESIPRQCPRSERTVLAMMLFGFIRRAELTGVM